MTKKTKRKPAAPPPSSGFAALRRYLALGALVVALAGVGGAAAIFANQSSQPPATATPLPTVPPPPATTPQATVTPFPTVRPVPRVDRLKGSASAKVSIVEYSDFQCPYCAVYATQIFPRLDELYVKTGKVKYLFRPVVVANHRQAQKATEAAECAGDQGKYWDMHDMLFARQTQWAERGGAVEIFKGYARSLGLQDTAFQVCLDGGKYAGVTGDNINDGRKAGVEGTPTFFINNRVLPSAYPLEEFIKVIDEELAK